MDGREDISTERQLGRCASTRPQFYSEGSFCRLQFGLGQRTGAFQFLTGMLVGTKRTLLTR